MVETGSVVAPPVPERFEAIYLEHHAFAGRCLLRLGVNRAGVDDARQDVFLTAFRRLRTYAGHASIRAWLGGIARRVAWRHRRTRQRHERRIDALGSVTPELLSLEDWVRTREARAVLDAFVEALDPPKREAFVLCELEGLSAREAASATGVNAATLYSRLRVARSSFASMCASLEQDGIAVRPEHAARIHREAAPPDRRAAQRGWLALAPKVAGASTLAVAKPLLAVVLGLGGLSAVAVTTTSDPPVASIAAPTLGSIPAPSSAKTPPRPVRAATVVPEVEPPAPAASPRTRPRRVAPEPTDDLAEQVSLLGRAEQQLSEGSLADAADSAAAYLERWPKGQLARDALRVAVRAHCGQNDRASAVAVAKAQFGARADAWVDERCKKTSAEFMNPEPAGD